MPVRKKRYPSDILPASTESEFQDGDNGKFFYRQLNVYLRHLFSRRFPKMDRDTLGFVCFCLGPERTRSLCDFARESLPGRLSESFEMDLGDADDEDDVGASLARFAPRFRKIARRSFEKRILSALADRAIDLETETLSQAEKNIATVGEIFGLGRDERDLLLFLLIVFVFEEADRFFMSRLSCAKPFFRRNMAALLGMTGERLNEALFGKLYRLKMIYIDGHSMSLNDSYVEILENPDKALKSRDSYIEASEAGLNLEAHMIDEQHTRILRRLLEKKRASSTHVLLYGPPGTGKTSYARALVKSLRVPAYEVVGNEQNCSVLRRGAILSCIHFTNGGDGSVIIVDEADGLLGTRQSWFQSGETRDKGWVNHLLEQEGLRMIWIVNDLNMDDSVCRRFAYSVQFHPFTRKQRLSVWRNVLQRYGKLGALTLEDVESLAMRHEVSAGGIDLAVRKASEAGIAERNDLSAFLDRTLLSHSTLMNEGTTPQKQTGAGRGFLVEGLNVQGDLPGLIGRVQTWNLHRQRFDSRTACSLRLLFHGPPGTGKTETAKYLAEVMDRDLMTRKASDILNMYVGGTEKNLASIFKRAEETGAVLLIDEADSFLIDRKNAVRSWEITQTNEFLCQLENFGGVVICSTNRIGELDHAAFRRFNAKIAFDYLTSEGNLLFYEKFLAPLAGDRLCEKEKDRLAAIPRLAPGDFKVVRNQYFLERERKPAHVELISALEAESRFKADENAGKVTGFTGNPTRIRPLVEM